MELKTEELTKIDYENVVYRQYFFLYKDFKKAVQSFYEDLAKENVHVNGPLFYSVDQIVRSDDGLCMYATIYQPIHEDKIPGGGGLNFLKTVEEDNLTYRVIGDNYVKNAEDAFNDILRQARDEGKEITSSFFHEVVVEKDEQGNKKVTCIIKARME